MASSTGPPLEGNPLEPIAIIGSSCRFAGGVDSPSKLWDLLCEAPDLSRQVPEERFNAKAFYHEDGEYHGTTDSIKAYWLDQDIRVFDAGFFNITPKEAEAMDPQQRLLLEVVFEALESAGFHLKSYAGKKVGVYAGVMTADYDTLSQRDELSTSQYYATGNARSIISNRISYFFNFQGPSMTIDTACSSSLVALHQAVLSLRAGESEVSCVSGVNLMLTPEQFIVESNLHMLSPNGRSRMWDAGADGYARGEGVAAIFLKPLSRALADGDRIEAVIRNSGCNSDGRTKGITMPNSLAQSDMITDAYRKLGLDPRNPEDRCQYFEAHGTGTQAGDPREASAIARAFFGDADEETNADVTPGEKLLVGSIKTVVGHTEGAAGLAGLMKVVQAMKHGSVPPNLHLQSLSPAVAPFYGHLQIPTTVVPWPEPPAGQPRRASVNSFGFGGTNAHVIVESYVPDIHGKRNTAKITAADQQAVTKTIQDGSGHKFYFPLLVSAASQGALGGLIKSYRNFLSQNEHVDITEFAWNLYAYKTFMPYRVSMSPDSNDDAAQALSSLLDRGANIGNRSTTTDEPIRILGIFTGQGAQWATMSRNLFYTNRVYRDTIRYLDDILRDCPRPPEWTLEEQIIAEPDVSRVLEVAISQSLCTALQVGLVDLLKTLDIQFQAVVGHSSGEIAAAYAAGRLTRKDAMLIAYYRGMGAHLASGAEGQNGGMLAARMSEKEAEEFCADPKYNGRISVAAINAPAIVTLSGDLDMIHLARAGLEEQQKLIRVLQVDAAYHSYHMKKAAETYVESMRQCDIAPIAENKDTVWVSSVQGFPRTGERDLRAQYWTDNLLNAVQFRGAVDYALRECGPFDCVIEVGPHPALKGPVDQISDVVGVKLPYYGLLNRGKDDSLAFSEFLGSIWSALGSLEIDMDAYAEQSPRSDILTRDRLELPNYAWDHSMRHYRESRLSKQYHFKTASPHELLGVRTRDDNNQELRWRNILKMEKIPWLAHHRFQGQSLLPASAYCIMALDASRYLLNDRPASLVELSGLRIMSGIVIEPESSGTEVLFSLKAHPTLSRNDDSVIVASFSMASCAADGTTTMSVNVEGTITITLEEPDVDVLPARQASESETLPANPGAFYKMMDETGLVYSGPFRSLTAIQRRHDYCSATLLRLHPEDNTSLLFSPSTLDSCFQSAFLTYASPGDKSLWTSFLPTTIDSIQFNIGELLRASRKDASLTVDAFLTDANAPSQESKASFVVDIGIFGQDGAKAIQVEGLAVAALANTVPKDDYELYLTTIMDIDPTDEIVDADLENATNDLDLADSCAKIASFLCKDEEAEASSLPTEMFKTEEEVQSFVRNSDHSLVLEEFNRIGKGDPNLLRDQFPAFVGQAMDLSCFVEHVGRVVKQIVHRYPSMNILCLMHSQTGLARQVLKSADSSYQSFTVGTEPDTNDEQSFKDANKPHMKALPVDRSQGLKGQLGSDNPYDLVVVSTTFLDGASAEDVLGNILTIMRPEAFVVFVHAMTPLSIASSNNTPSLPAWHDKLAPCGFTQVAKNSDQGQRSGRCLMVRQAHQPTLDIKTAPLEQINGEITNQILLIGGATEATRSLSINVRENLSQIAGEVLSRDTFEAAAASELESSSCAIILADLDEPTMSSMTEDRLDKFRGLFRPDMTILWVTHNARHANPDHAATLGFMRTIVAEHPNLTVQALDLETVESSERIIVETFVRLILFTKTDDGSLWTTETEIHLENGRRIIPRIVPLKQSNHRVNSMRRLVSKPLNTLQESVTLIPNITSEGLIRYNAQANDLIIQKPPESSVLIHVEYSSTEPIQLSFDLAAYLVFGRDMVLGKNVIALAARSSSFILCPSAHTLATGSGARGSLLMHYVLRYLKAAASASLLQNQHVVLIDPDVKFVEVLGEIASVIGCKITCYATTEEAQGGLNGAKYIHPKAATRDLKKIFPPAGAVIIDFLPESSELSARIRTLVPSNSLYQLLPSNCTFHTSLLPTNRSRFDYLGPGVTKIWNDALTSALRKLSVAPNNHESFDTSSLSRLQSAAQQPAPFQIIDWTIDRGVVQTIAPIVGGRLLRPNKTYILFGLTRDLGQSLCQLFLAHGAKNIVLASRNPNTDVKWPGELMRAHGARIVIERADVTKPESIEALKANLKETMPPVGGIINGAMVLIDRVFSKMDIAAWNGCMRPKTVGSKNLDDAFPGPELEFFIMTSSFAAIGGHPGQSNYATANMYMNGLAADRRRRGLAGSVLNIGVIYGLGFLQREKEGLYSGLEREGYPPISPQDIHHMFLEAIVSGRPYEPDQPFDITTGMRRFVPGDANALHWHADPRFSHLVAREDADAQDTTDGGAKQNLKEIIAGLTERDDIAEAIVQALSARLETALQLPEGHVNRADDLSQLGVDSLAAVEIRKWIYSAVGREMPILKLLSATSIERLCVELAEQILAERGDAAVVPALPGSLTAIKPPVTPLTGVSNQVGKDEGDKE